jgi:hypothetical protein
MDGQKAQQQHPCLPSKSNCVCPAAPTALKSNPKPSNSHPAMRRVRYHISMCELADVDRLTQAIRTAPGKTRSS